VDQLVRLPMFKLVTEDGLWLTDMRLSAPDSRKSSLSGRDRARTATSARRRGLSECVCGPAARRRWWSIRPGPRSQQAQGPVSIVPSICESALVA